MPAPPEPDDPEPDDPEAPVPLLPAPPPPSVLDDVDPPDVDEFGDEEEPELWQPTASAMCAARSSGRHAANRRQRGLAPASGHRLICIVRSLQDRAKLGGGAHGVHNTCPHGNTEMVVLRSRSTCGRCAQTLGRSERITAGGS